jgi:hypothetical protein
MIHYGAYAKVGRLTKKNDISFLVLEYIKRRMDSLHYIRKLVES